MLSKPAVMRIGAVMASFFLIMGFQNCSSEMEFKTASSLLEELGDVDPGDVICNPLGNQTGCNAVEKNGLLGNLYYLTPQHASLFNNNLNNATLSDYQNLGVKVPQLVQMSEIDISPRPWTAGFVSGDGSVVKDSNGNDLFEWFHLDLHGFIYLPTDNYQFAIVSDDGMRVTIAGTVAVVDDGTHSPRWTCGSVMIPMSQPFKQHIRVEYFQGPRTQIAMQLYMRSASKAHLPCDATGGWEIVPASALTHKL